MLLTYGHTGQKLRENRQPNQPHYPPTPFPLNSSFSPGNGKGEGCSSNSSSKAEYETIFGSDPNTKANQSTETKALTKHRRQKHQELSGLPGWS